jgi:hypothetical protein
MIKLTKNLFGMQKRRKCIERLFPIILVSKIASFHVLIVLRSLNKLREG